MPNVLSNEKLIQRVIVWKIAKANPEYTAGQIAELLGRPEWSVRRALKLREATPKEMLEALEPEAVSAWRDALPIAGKKGDHRPAKDLLLHTKAIQPVADQQHAGITVLIGQVLLPGVSPTPGNFISEKPNDSSVIDACVTEALPGTPTPGTPGADTRERDPPGGSG